MPIKSPGSRIGSSVHLKSLKVGTKAGAKRSLLVSLNLTPMIDMFTILVVFLLITFSATGEILFQQSDIKIPKAYKSKPLERVPIIGISNAVILFEGQMVMPTAGVSEKNFADLSLPPLAKILREAQEAYRRAHPMPSDSEGLKKWLEDSKQIIIQADEGVKFEVVRLVMTTAGREGYSAINFAVVPKGSHGS